MDEKFRFSVPIEFGIEMYNENKKTTLYAGHNKRLIDEFLDELIAVREKRSDKTSFTLYNGNEDNSKPIILSFADSKMIVTEEECKYTIDIDFDMFFNAFIQHVRIYALYYVAPFDYFSVLNNSPFTEFTEEIEKYRPQETVLLQKIKAY